MGHILVFMLNHFRVALNNLMNSHDIHCIQRHHRHHHRPLFVAWLQGTLATYGGGYDGGRRSLGATGLQFMSLCERFSK